MTFMAIDFETANSSRTSACALGIIEVKDGEILNEYSYLINPEEDFDDFNIYIHGITPDMIKDKPTFPQVWNEIKSILQSSDLIIAHNASFDISVLRHVLNKYNLDYPEFHYSCTRILSKKTWQSFINYKLDTVANYLNIKFKHHEAISDARAASKVFNKILETNNTNNIEELHNKLRVNIGHIFKDGYKPSEIKSSSYNIRVKDMKPTTDIFDKSSEFYNKTVSFTGTLSMPRKEVMQMVVDVGGNCTNNVTKSTNYLVMGIQDYSKFTDGQKSNKLKKAEDLIFKGQDLEIISEDEFFNLL